MKRRVLCAILAVLLVLTPVSALADGSCGQNIKWSLSEANVLTISGTGRMADFAAGEAPWYPEREKIRSVTVTDGVESIGSGAFYGCTLIEEMTLPLSLKSIGDGAVDGVCLRKVYYGGSIAQWKEIDIGYGVSFGVAELICADKSEPFADISGWYHDYIITCYMADIISGFGDGTFRPELNVTRAQFAIMLYNMGGRPEVSGAGLDFTDAGSIHPSALAAVRWGVRAGIIKGFDDGSFRPDESITRAQMATFAYRFLRLGVDGNTLIDFMGAPNFSDSESILECYREAANVMSALGVIQGYPDGRFAPDDTATRAQAATVSVRLLTAIAELNT